MNKLINLSEASSIAIHSLALIAKVDQHINANSIAKLTGFSKNHLSKILQMLVKHGYLNSHRGPKGGFYLSKSADKITLLEFYELIEGRSTDTLCTDHNPSCPFLDCIYGDIMEEISQIFIKAFGSRTIADVLWKPGINASYLLERLNYIQL